ARDQSPDDHRIFQGLARIEAAAGDLDAAEETLRRGLEAIAEGDAEGRIQLLWSLAETKIDAGDHDEAGKVIAELREADVRPGLLDYLEGKVRIGEGRWREAIDALRDARTLLTGQAELTYQIDLLLGA